jgi:UDP-galactopyranose mutase
MTFSLPPDNGAASARKLDLLCFSHLRWDFVYQRPQHLMSRFARDRRVFYVEEPVFGADEPRLEIRRQADGVAVVVPHLPYAEPGQAEAMQRRLVDGLIADEGIGAHVAWFYTPMALGVAGHLRPRVTVFDCMDELSAFRFAPPALREREAELMRRADLVFAGGASLFEARRGRHPSVHLFPSSIDAAHFGQARGDVAEPADQADIPHPRIGFFGVLDERFDAALVGALAAARPDWHFVLVGPTAKVEPADLPQGPNLHYLGPRAYADLPSCAAGWDAAALFFAMNESTRFISPTKTPEYLAAGRRTVSSPIHDVVRGWGGSGLVRIADTVEDWVAALEEALADENRDEWLRRVDEALARGSWESTWAGMDALIEDVALRADRPAADAGSADRVDAAAAAWPQPSERMAAGTAGD